MNNKNMMNYQIKGIITFPMGVNNVIMDDISIRIGKQIEPYDNKINLLQEALSQKML